MKKLILLLFIVTAGNISYSQVVCAGVSPASISGNYNFSWGDPINTWSSPDFNIPGITITGELMLVDDGSIGNSPASGLPLANYGCATLLNDLTGKIAVVYRYDGVTASTICWMSEKALIAQNAGAIAVLIINRPGANSDLGTGGGAEAPNVNIPVVLIDYNDGALLRAEMQNGPVNMFFGNKTGLYANDIGVVKEKQLRSKSFGVISQLAADGTEFNFDLGTRIYNYGTNDQTNVTITANVEGPSGSTVYNNSVGPISIISGDSIDVIPGETYFLPQFALSAYPTGKYTLTYTVSLGVTDEYDGDNVNTTTFVVNDSIYSYAALDPITNWPTPTAGYRPSTSVSSYSTCIVVNDPNASRIGVLGMYFSALTAYGSGISLEGEEMVITVYRWEDPFTDLNDPTLAFTTLNPLTFDYYYYPSDLQNQVVLATFANPVFLEDNQRFLACVQTSNTAIYLGHDIKTDYTWNQNNYLQPMFPIEADGVYSAGGFGSDLPSAVGVKVFSVTGIDESASIDCIAYPNPATNAITVSLNAEGTAQLSVTDLSGRVAMNNTINLVNGKSELSISSLEAGMYIFNITTEGGKTSQFNVVKK